ncbi:MAG: biotin--[acetyl-CoA-carboxylase] ligase [Bacteroidota bacterium]
MGKVLLHFPTLDSTNQSASELLTSQQIVQEGTVISTFHQVRGRGQMGNSWLCPPDVNIAMSVILKPHFLVPTRQFLLNCIAALAVRDTLATYTQEQVSVKWPNDVLIEDKKVCGILIQNTLSTKGIVNSIIGIGINVNQSTFSSTLPHATSLYLATQQQHDLKHVQQECLARLERYYLSLRAGNIRRIEIAYRSQLYAYKEQRTYQTAAGEVFEATSIGVNKLGQLVLIRAGEQFTFNVKEVTLLKKGEPRI